MSTAISALGPVVTTHVKTALETAEGGPNLPQPARPQAPRPPALSNEQMKALREECATYRNRPGSESPPTDLLEQLATPGPVCLMLDMMDTLREMPQNPK